ncbi:MAG TPA: transglycosylase SLT domain-containing protein, partial [Anaerolineaceae bacterium]|nr:transglycosylase SLT domain-containing protein [Anaerolineaceae bacterium]
PSPTPTPTPVPEERITIAETSYFEGDYQKSIAELELAKNNSTDDNIRALSDIGISQIYILQTKFSDASNILLPIIENKSIKEDIRAKASYFYGVSQENLNNPIAAAQGYTGFNQFSPGKLDSFMYEKAGDVLNQFQYYDEALEKYQLAIDQIQSGDSLTIKIKIGKIYAAQADHTNAIRVFMEVYDSSPNEFTRAQMNLLTGQSYLALGIPEQAYARFQDSVQNYPRAFDTHSGLVALVNAGIPVDEFNRGMTNYYAGSYGLAINAFLRYIDQNPDHNGNAYYFIGHAYRRIDEPQNAIFSWDYLIDNYPENLFFVDTWKDIAYTQWAFLNQYGNAAQTLLTFAENYPLNDEAPAAVVEAGRIYERNNQLTDAATTWATLIDLYPQMEISSEALFYSALTNYRLTKYDQSLSQFQRYLLLTSIPEQKASAYFWIAKVYEQLGDLEKSQSSLMEASRQDPTGYYSLRAKEKLSSAQLFSPFSAVDLNVNLDQERLIAEVWMRNTFSLPQDTNFITLVSFSSDPAFIKATSYWDLGLYHLARNEYEILRTTYKDDPVNLFRLTNHFLDIGLYRSAILSSRQILDLANMDDDTSLSAPLWFNHIRFGLFFSDLIEQSALDYNFDPLLIYSLIRQESFFEGFIISSAGAKGLMQIMSPTGQEIADILRWPTEYQESDLYRPVINIRMGTSYLSRMRTFFDGDIYAALAAYNAGPGNVLKWIEKSNNDPDLFLETIPFEETRRYLRNIYTFYRIYEILYPVRTAE